MTSSWGCPKAEPQAIQPARINRGWDTAQGTCLLFLGGCWCGSHENIQKCPLYTRARHYGHLLFTDTCFSPSTMQNEAQPWVLCCLKRTVAENTENTEKPPPRFLGPGRQASPGHVLNLHPRKTNICTNLCSVLSSKRTRTIPQQALQQDQAYHGKPHWVAPAWTTHPCSHL